MLEFRLSDTVRLRLPEEADAPELYRLVERNRAYLAVWLPWAAGQTELDTLDYIRRKRRQLADNEGLETAIEVDGALAGMVGMVALDHRNRSTALGYWLAEEHQGKGVMTAAVRAYLNYAFGALGLNRVEIGAGVDNHRSRAIPERLGFTLEGVRRRGEVIGARTIDHAVYSLLAEEWARP